MKLERIAFEVQVPSLDDFSQAYPQYGSFAAGDGRPLFDLLVSPEVHLRARFTTEDQGLPAVAGVARASEALIGRSKALKFTPFVKQFMGAVVCCSMEANRFRKTGRKRAIPHPAFTKGELYEAV